MCGLVALLSGREPLAADTDLAMSRALDRLHHRGPDGRGVWISHDRRVALGHARLSIIDVEGGRQPIANETSDVHIVVNGELYDHDRIGAALAERGHRLRTKSDSEIALHLYEELGVHCLAQLRGEFALVLWDSANKVLFAARDRLGIKPLFYAQHGSSLALASEAKALFALGVAPEWDVESFYQVLQAAYFNQDRSLFRGVNQVPPGHYLVATPDSGPRIYRYWDFDYPRRGDYPDLDAREHIERVGSELREAVRLRMRADVPVGCYLSGGIDSAGVLGIAAQVSARPIDTFTISLPNDPFNEVGFAHEIATHAGARFHSVEMSYDVLADAFADAVWHSEITSPNLHTVAYFLLSRAVRDRGIKVILNGQGSDEVFGGYAPFEVDHLVHSGDYDAGTIRSQLQRIERNLGSSAGWLLSGDMQGLDTSELQRVLGFVPSWAHTRLALMGAHFATLLDQDVYARLAPHDPFRRLLASLDVAGQLQGRDPLHQSMYLWSKSFLCNYLLNTNGDRMEMAHSVEGRQPYLDHHLLRAVREVPPALKIHGEVEKYVLREVVRPIAPTAVVARKKSAFLLPPPTLRSSGRMYDLLQDTLRGPSLAAVPFFDRGRVIALLDRLDTLSEADHRTWGSLLNIVMSTCVLQERFKLGCDLRG